MPCQRQRCQVLWMLVQLKQLFLFKHIIRPCSRPLSSFMGFQWWKHVTGLHSHWMAMVTKLYDWKIYRKPLDLLDLMGKKTMVSCRFSRKPMHWSGYETNCLKFFWMCGTFVVGWPKATIWLYHRLKSVKVKAGHCGKGIQAGPCFPPWLHIKYS